MRITSFFAGLAVAAALCMTMLAGPVMAAGDFNIVTHDNIITLDSLGQVAGATDINAIDYVQVAVDNSISTLCRPGASESYSRPGGFCDAVAANALSARGNGGHQCPVGYEPNPAPPPACIPEV
jgi:hypothetical protein